MECHYLLTMKKFLTSALMLAMITAGMSATNFIGYSDGNVGRSTIFRTATEQTGLAVKIPAEKLRLLAGKKITGLEIAVGSKNTNEKKMTLFVSESLGGDAKISGVFDIAKANSWETYEFAQPYTITGEENGLYIGYTMDIPSTYQPLSADQSSPISGVTFALYGDEWRDIYDMGVGQGNIRALLDSDPEITDMIIKPLMFNGYFKKGNSYSFEGELFNFGTKSIENFSVSLQIGNDSPQTYEISESVAPGKSYKFKIPDYTANECGNLDVRLEVTKVNGVSSDDDPSDNAEETEVFFYPEEMERALLIENFTGQECSNCPSGHRALENVTEAWTNNEENPELITVAHHAGYMPDDFTREEDLEYTCFYNGGTYAPAFMVNRLRCSGQNAPVFNATETLLTNALNAAVKTMPYVSLNVVSNYDPATRKIDINVKTRTFNDIPEKTRTLNIMLCQDNIVASQSGMGSNYVHHNAFRTTLTGNAWGVELPMKTGTIDEYETSYTIPEVYTSSNTGGKFAAVPDDMFLVVYASTFDQNDVNKRYILNCVKIGLGESKVQNGFSAEVGVDVNDVKMEFKPTFRVENGRISANVECAGIEVYDMAGVRHANENLCAGLYIVRAVTAEGNVYSAKVLVR